MFTFASALSRAPLFDKLRSTVAGINSISAVALTLSAAPARADTTLLNVSYDVARELVTKIFRNVPVLDSGGRAATTTFTQRETGDMLVTFENEVQLVKKEMGQNFDVVYPATSILAESPVAVVDKVVDKKTSASRPPPLCSFCTPNRRRR